MMTSQSLVYHFSASSNQPLHHSFEEDWRACLSPSSRLWPLRHVFKLAVALTLTLAASASGAVAAPAHFDPQGKPPSTFTLDLRKGMKARLPFDDKRDFEEAKRGFIAAPPFMQIKADAGHVAWDMGSYQWLLSGQDFASIHPSLQRQAVLNMAYGLYEVVPGRIYQVRGFDLANISFIKSDRVGLSSIRSPPRKRHGPRSNSSTRSSASGRLLVSSTPTPMPIISAVCAASLTRPML